MKTTFKFKNLGLCLLIITAFLQGAQIASACSVHINQDSTKDSMRQALATHYGLPVSAIQRTDLTKAGFSFVNGLGADCSGLEDAIISSAFTFTAVKNLQRCTYKGVILEKEAPPANDYFINDENPSNCTPVIVPVIPPIFPRIPRLPFGR